MNVESRSGQKRSIAYIGSFSFPNGGAAARRILGNAKALQAAGFEVVIACGQMATDGQPCSVAEGIEVISLNERTAEHLPRLLKHMAYLPMGRKTIAWLDTLDEKPYALVLYSGYSPYLLRLIPWAKRHGVKVVFDAVEWYDPASMLGWLSPYQLNIELAMRWLLPKAGNVVSISDYLHRYYLARGCRSIKVPPTLDVANTLAHTKGRDPGHTLQLVYAGSPGKKDLLDNILEAVLRLQSAGRRLRLSVAGIPATAAIDYRAVRTRPPAAVNACIDFKGVLSHDASLALVRNADFSLLLRNDARYSRAGFPTKFVESMAVGTPVIANLTSDLGLYLQNEVTGFACAGASPYDLEVCLSKALKMSLEKHTSMRTRCRALAEEAFDYRRFSAQFANFLDSAKV